MSHAGNADDGRVPEPVRAVTPRAALRASDSDREQTAAHLRQAAAEGRLLADELEHRLDVLFSARTYGELDAIVSDLPQPRSPEPDRRPALSRLRPFLAAAVALVLVLVMLAAAGAVVRVHTSSAAPEQVIGPAIPSQVPSGPRAIPLPRPSGPQPPTAPKPTQTSSAP